MSSMRRQLKESFLLVHFTCIYTSNYLHNHHLLPMYELFQLCHIFDKEYQKTIITMLCERRRGIFFRRYHSDKRRILLTPVQSLYTLKSAMRGLGLEAYRHGIDWQKHTAHIRKHFHIHKQRIESYHYQHLHEYYQTYHPYQHIPTTYLCTTTDETQP